MAKNLIPAEVFSPGEFIREELQTRGWTANDLAAKIKCPIQMVDEMLAGKKAIDAELAQALSNAFRTSAEYFLNLQHAYRLRRKS